MASLSRTNSVHHDETACGPFCQHPQCWASNRRVGRGLPRVAKSPVPKDENLEDELPTMKIFNFLDEYGESSEDRYPSKGAGKDTKIPSHIRSASAPNIMAAYNRSPLAAYTPFASPMGVKASSVRSTRSAKTTSRSRSRTTPKISRLEIQQMLGDLGDLPPPSAESSSFYIWCPSKKSYKKQGKKSGVKPQSSSKEPSTICPKDLTDEMVPNNVEKKRSKTQKSKRNIHETPTGGRPYTHPTRSPPPIARRTLPQDIDDGINQLLSLPRDVLMEVLDHIKKSDLLDKSKVQLLLNRLMPLIHFTNEDGPMTPRGSIMTPLLDSGILQNHKITLHDLQEKQELTQTPGNAPFFLDDAALSIMASSACDMTQVIEEQQDDSPRTEEPMETIGRMAKTRPLGPIKGSQRESEHIYRISSVSAKTLPPLKPGVKPVKPFNYTNNAATLDLTLVPLPKAKPASPERSVPTPFSAIASTLHVTMPSVPSPDRTVNSTPVFQYGKSPIPPVVKSSVARTSPSPLPSEEFPELHWYDADVEEMRNPLHALSPSMSTRVPKTPLGTPATALRQQLLTRETTVPSKVLSEHAEEESGATSSSPTPHPPIRTATAMSEAQLGTIHETGSIDSTYPLGDSTTGFNSRSDYITSPSKLLMSSMSPYGFGASIAGQILENSNSALVPITPAPTSATEDSWPNIDERDYMRTPDTNHETVMTNQAELPAPAAPPPSPEPRDPNQEFDFEMPEVSKSATLSLTPLAEEEEELDVKDKREPEAPASTPQVPATIPQVPAPTPQEPASFPQVPAPTPQVPSGDDTHPEKRDGLKKTVDQDNDNTNENKVSEDVDEDENMQIDESGVAHKSNIDEQSSSDKNTIIDPGDQTLNQDINSQNHSGPTKSKGMSNMTANLKTQQNAYYESKIQQSVAADNLTDVTAPPDETVKTVDEMRKIETKMNEVRLETDELQADRYGAPDTIPKSDSSTTKQSNTTQNCGVQDSIDEQNQNSEMREDTVLTNSEHGKILNRETQQPNYGQTFNPDDKNQTGSNVNDEKALVDC